MSEKQPIDDFVTRFLPAGTQLSFGALSGWAAGYALRQGGKVVGVLVGGGFMFIQSLAYSGYLEVDWRKIERDYNRLLDLDKDGQVTAKDFQKMLDGTTEVLKFNLPAGSGFSGGFLYGLSGSAKLALGGAALYGGATSVALGGIPTDLFDSSKKSLEGLMANPSGIMDQLSAGRDKFLATMPKLEKVPLQEKLRSRSIEELRQLEWEVKNNVAISAEMFQIDLNAQDKDTLLDEIEASKKYVKGY